MHYPQNTISHCIISNETQIALYFFQGRISAMPEIFLAISETGMGLLTSSFFNILLFWFPAGQGLKKKLVLVLFFNVTQNLVRF